jgi:hypothetical protein
MDITGSREDLEQAYKALEWEAPDTKSIIEELTRLKMLTASRNLTVDELTLQISLYAEELSAYPMDAIRAAIRAACEDKWWPTWADLKEDLDFYSQNRRLGSRAICRALDKMDSVQMLVGEYVKKIT